MAWFLKKSNNGYSGVKIIVGLGNPGPKYKNNRHNVGFMIIDGLGEQHNALLKRSFMLKGFTAKIKIKGRDTILIKPSTFMNNSGLCVKRALAHYRVCKENLLVVHDDADLPSGALRFRKSGSSGGHNGMSSIIDNLGIKEINRLRVGIGKAEDKDLVEYVLSNFSSQEQVTVQTILEKAASACIDWASYGSDYVMSKYNQMRL